MHNSSISLRRVIAVGLFSLVPAVLSAQPRTGQVAAGADVGMFVAADDHLHSGLMADSFVDFYPAPRFGIGPIITAIRNGYDRFDDDMERQLRVGVDVI